MIAGIHFNSAGVAPLPFRVVLEVCQFLAHFYLLGPRSALLKYEQYIPKLAQEIATLLNCKPEEITYLKNTSEGIAIAAETLPLKPGDELLIARCLYPANLIPWLKKRNDGINVQVIEGADPETCYTQLLATISDKTRAIVISWVHFVDGYTIDLKALSKICRARNIFLVVDAVQIVGTRPIDLREYDVDFLICGGHKHLMSLVGSGFIYINQALLPRLKPFKVGIRSVKKFDSHGFDLKDGAGRFEDGMPNFLGIVALHSRIRAINKMGVHFIEQRTLELGRYYKVHLMTHGFEIVNHPVQGNMISITMDRPAEVMAWLEKRRVYVRVINNRFIRISYTYKNRKRDIQRLVHLLKIYQSPKSSLLEMGFKALGWVR